MNHHFVVVWDNLGLEYVGDITADEVHRSWSALKGKPAHSTLPNLNHLILRARYNSARCYEIWQVEASEGITAEDIENMFNQSPQTAADLIRERGHCLYSDRANQDKIVIR